MVENRGKLKAMVNEKMDWVKVVDIVLGTIAFVSSLGIIAILMFMEG